MTPGRGYVTVASGDRRYLEFAVDLALSIREFNPEPITLVLGDELRAFATDAHRAVFDGIAALPEGYPAYLGKLAAPGATPYERTLYVDADCMVIGTLAGLWDRLAPACFAAQGQFLAADKDIEHHGFSTAALIGRFGLSRYFKCNTGFLYFRKAPGIAVADACMGVRRDAFGGRMTCDEILLGIVAEAHEVFAIRRPWPMPWSGHAVNPRETAFQIVHFIGAFRVDTLTWLLMEMRRRRKAAGLPPDDSTPMWLAKATQRDGIPVDPATRFGFDGSVAARHDGR